jgi:hypothetical protein
MGMRNLPAWLLLIMSALGTIYAHEATGTSTITLGGGWLVKNPFGSKGGPVFNANYEYRLRSEGLRYREIAEVIGISPSTVDEFLRRAISRLSEAARG